MNSYSFDDEVYQAEWAIEGVLARAQRPGYPADRPPAETVRRWSEDLLRLGVRSVICLLDQEQLSHYDRVAPGGGGLLAFYGSLGLHVSHIPADDYKTPPLSEAELAAVWSAFQRLEKPVLVHCSAGRDRSGAAVDHIRSRRGGGDA